MGSIGWHHSLMIPKINKQKNQHKILGVLACTSVFCFFLSFTVLPFQISIYWKTKQNKTTAIIKNIYYFWRHFRDKILCLVYLFKWMKIVDTNDFNAFRSALLPYRECPSVHVSYWNSSHHSSNVLNATSSTHMVDLNFVLFTPLSNPFITL